MFLSLQIEFQTLEIFTTELKYSWHKHLLKNSIKFVRCNQVLPKIVILNF